MFTQMPVDQQAIGIIASINLQSSCRSLPIELDRIFSHKFMFAGGEVEVDRNEIGQFIKTVKAL